MRQKLKKYVIACKQSYLGESKWIARQALNKALEFIVKDYAYKRPHGTLKGLTPHQAYTGHRPEDVSFAPQLQSAREIRIIMNQSHNCSGKCHLK